MNMVRVLIIGCDPADVRSFTPRLHTAFKDRRVLIDAADRAVSAVLLVRTHGYDAILLKPVTPSRLGGKFIEQLQGIQPHARIVVVTAADEEVLDVQAGIRSVSHLLPFREVAIVLASLCPTPTKSTHQWYSHRAHKSTYASTFPMPSRTSCTYVAPQMRRSDPRLP
jgi:hypothetical protein